MSDYYGMPRSARLVSRHLHSLFGDARREGVTHEELTIELAAHATCAALSFWPAEELHARQRGDGNERGCRGFGHGNRRRG